MNYENKISQAVKSFWVTKEKQGNVLAGKQLDAFLELLTCVAVDAGVPKECVYLKNNHIKDNTSTPGLQEARKKLLYMTMSDSDRRAYDAHMDDIMVQNDVLDTAKMEGRAEGRAEGLEEGRAEGRAEGLEEGVQKKALEVAKNLKSMGLSIQDIQRVTGLSKDEIESL